MQVDESNITNAPYQTNISMRNKVCFRLKRQLHIHKLITN